MAIYYKASVPMEKKFAAFQVDDGDRGNLSTPAILLVSQEVNDQAIHVLYSAVFEIQYPMYVYKEDEILWQSNVAATPLCHHQDQYR